MKFPVSDRKAAALAGLMVRAGIDESDLRESFVRGSGPGGQKINKTSMAVHLRHIPSGTDVRCEEARSQAMNRYLARRNLAEKMLAAMVGEKTATQQRMEKTRRQKRRRSRRAKAKMLNEKRQQGAQKVLRRAPTRED